MNENHCVLYTV